jgi:hypothetical protein
VRVSKNYTICGLAAPAARQLMRAYHDDLPIEVRGAMNAGANSWAFWIRLIGALALLYILPTLIDILRRVDGLAVVVILNLFPIAWPAALMVACMMPRREDR